MSLSLPAVKFNIARLVVYTVFVLFLMALSGWPQPVLAQSSNMTNSTDTASAQLELFADQVLSASGKFSQVVKNEKDADSKQEQTQTGEFAFKRPGKFVWNVKQPYEQLVISDGAQIFQYDPDLEQVTQRSSGTAVSNSPAALLFGSGALADTFTIKDLPDEGNTHWLQATPKQKDAGFVHVDIGFKNGLPVQLNLLDSFGQTTKISFKDFKINPELPADKFKFTVPEGVDLVKMD